MRINTAVNKSRDARKYSITIFNLGPLTNFLIADPKIAHGDIDKGQTIRATSAITSMEAIKCISFMIKPEAAILEIDQAFGFTIWNNAAL